MKKVITKEMLNERRELEVPDYLVELMKKEKQLIENILENKDKLYELKHSSEQQLGVGKEDVIYRFYHESFKVYNAQEWTLETKNLFKELLDGELNRYYLQIIKDGTGKKFSLADNRSWTESTRTIVEAYLHTKHLLDLMIKYGIEGNAEMREGSPGWFTVLYLYNIR